MKTKMLFNRQGIWNKLLSAILVLTVVITGIYMPRNVFAEETTGKDVTDLLKPVEVKLTTPDGQPIADGAELDGKKSDKYAC